MLTLTETAMQAVQGIVSNAAELSADTAGLRLFAETTAAGDARLELSLENEPSDGDQVVEDAGVRVFVDAELAPLLADKELDAQPGEKGTQFWLRDRGAQP